MSLLPRLMLLMLLVLPVNAWAQVVSSSGGSNPLNTVYLQYINVTAGSELAVTDFFGDDTRLAGEQDRYDATPYSRLVTGDRFRIAITRPNSTAPGDVIWEDSLDAVDQLHVAVALVGRAGADASHNPDGLDVTPTAAVIPDAIVEGVPPNTMLINFLHAAGDAAWMAAGVSTDTGTVSLTDSVSFGSYAGYTEVPKSVSSGEVYFYVSQYGPPLGCGGDAIDPYHACYRINSELLLQYGNVFTVVLPEWDPEASSDPSVLAVFPNGVVVSIAVHATLGVGDNTNDLTQSTDFFPTPATDQVSAVINSATSGMATASIFDLVGRRVGEADLGPVAIGESASRSIDTSYLAAGLYSVQIKIVGHNSTAIHRGMIIISR